MRNRKWFYSLATAAFVFSTQAYSYQQGPVQIGQPYARPTVQGQQVAAGYMKIVNSGKANDRLLEVKSNVSQSVELHSMRMDGDIARMRQVDVMEIPAGKTVELKPSGLHLMFVGLQKPLLSGSSFPAVLKFEKAGDINVVLKVEPSPPPLQ